MTAKKFKEIIWKYYKNNKRDLPWRKTHDPYKILVSEMMLQQTQVARVIPKYKSFLKKFPSVQALAQAPLRDVLLEWQGLGYNRRGMYLKKCAEKVTKDFAGKFPRDFKTLTSLPGIGPATAGDICAFAYNIPAVVIETNIRAVFIHFFFAGKEKISDTEILPLIEKTLDQENPREWYWGLFDYGAYLKSTKIKNPNHKSKHYIKQSPFKDSYRQKRAGLLRTLLQSPNKRYSRQELKKILGYQAEILSKLLSDLEKEGFIHKTQNNTYFIKS